MDADFWRGKRVFLTGHTGFKGGWLGLWLQSAGAVVRGLALKPSTIPNLFTEAQVGRCMESILADIRDPHAVTRALQEFEPEIVLHLAAQPLVRLSYELPLDTYATNVMGTVHLLEAVRRAGSVRVVVNVTTDKCYENREWAWGYRENEPMGGHDPYSSSKACSELVTAAYRRSFLGGSGVSVASARAGNVIGGGDWSADRLVPDALRAFERDLPLRVRNPGSTRPWQHVLDPLDGYLTLAQRLWGDGGRHAEGWNFGPAEDDARPVRWIADRLALAWGQGARWMPDEQPGQPHEARALRLDTSKARDGLGWRPRWSLQTALDMTVQWHQAWHHGEDMRTMCLEQIRQHQATERSWRDDTPTHQPTR